MTSDGTVQIRRAGNEDLDDVARVWHASALEMDGAPFAVPALPVFRDRIDHELGAGWDLYIAERDARAVGMLAIKPAEAILDQIFVLPDQQGSGVGTELLNQAKRLMPNGFTLRMATANRRAARFYEHSGLSVVGEGTHPVSGVPVQYLGWN